MRFYTRSIASVLLWTSLLSAAYAQGEPMSQDKLWQSIRNGSAIILMRHALAPGIGDPDSMQLDDCATQRNLSAAGREQSEATGKLIRSQGIDRAQVFSSQWCRCLDTATLLGLGPVEPLPLLNSIFRRSGVREEQTQDLRSWIKAATASRSDSREALILVTHQVNVSALTGQYFGSREMVVVAVETDELGAKELGTEGLVVLGSIPAEPSTRP